MAVFDILWAFMTGLLWAMAGFLVFVPIGRELFLRWRGWAYPYRIIILKNVGGGADNRSVALPKNIYLYGKVQKTEFGERMKIWGHKHSYPMDYFPRDKAVNILGGGVGYIVYEKELDQYFPTHLFLEPESGEKGAKLRAIHEWLTGKYPSLADSFKLEIPTPKEASAVTFRNTEVKLRPFPIDAVTPYTYNIRMRNQRTTQPNKFLQYAPYAALALIVIMFIVGMVLYFEFVENSVTRMTGQVADDRTFIEDTFNNYAGVQETPPGGQNPPGGG